ncbi:TRZ/ATZ family hydrolase [Thiotrichales bacterium 19S9-12]|nr:TRZ/ATZ family hydrolase [Thiotrichales bacterium 19S9-11]MCF6811930.1 TRZ/ATZ family hydrolase [Thiotrichales bacterium 19S9-12]
MKLVDLIIKAKWILPIRPKNIVLEDYAIVIKDGVIFDLLPSNQVDTQYQAKELINRPHHVLMPGLINAHTHLAMSYYRGLKDDVSLDQWLNQYMWPAERKTVSAEYVYDGTLHALAECIRGGVTCVNDHYFYTEQVTKASKEAKIRGRLANCIYHFGTPWASSGDICLEHQQQLIDLLSDESLLSCAIGPHSPYGVNDEIMEKVMALSNQYNLPVHIHLHETQKEVDDFISQFGMSPIQYYASKGWLNDKIIAVHMTVLDEKDIQLVKEYNVKVVHCPESNMKLSSGISPVQQLLDQGVVVGLGTDSSASNNDIDMISEMRSAAFLAKVTSLNPESLSAETVIEMATINNAKVLELDHQIGSLEVNKQADMIAIDLNYPETMPVYNPMSQVVYAVSRNQVSDLWVSGECLMENRVLLTIDESSLFQKQSQWAEKIKEAIHW